MPLAPALPAALLETVLTGIAALFLAGANGDATLARQAARELLADYQPRTSAELTLAATIISCALRSLDVLVQASAKDLPVAQMLRLQASAIGLCREAAKAQRQLMQLQKERKPARPAEAAPTQPEPAPAPAPQPTQEPATRPLGPIAQFAKDRGMTWSKAYQEREREKRIAASLKRAEAKVAAANAAATQPPVTPGLSP